jgi:hypothetical protein
MAADDASIPDWGKKLATVASHIEVFSQRSGELPASIMGYLSRLNGLLSDERYQKILPKNQSELNKWDHLPIDTSDIELAIRIFGLIQINGKPFIPNGAPQSLVSTRFSEIPKRSQAYQLVSNLVDIEKRYSDWLRDYQFGLDQGPLSPEVRQKALARLFPKYEVIYCTGNTCAHGLKLSGDDSKIFKIIGQEVEARGLKEITIVSPGGCNKACGLVPVEVYSTDEQGVRHLEVRGHLGICVLADNVRKLFDSDGLKLDTQPTPYELGPSNPVEEKVGHSLCELMKELH